MTGILTPAPRSLGRAAVAALAAALLGAATFMAAAPGSASAARNVCGAGDFCLYYLYGFSGGLYHFSGSDANLDNDRFANGVPVGGGAESARNNGRASSNGHDDVIVYTGRGRSGHGACIRLGQKGDLAGGFVNKVHSYAWVTPATCNRYKSALAPRR